MTLTPRWQAAPDLECRSWNGQWVVYCNLSGDTMLLEPIAATLFRHLLQGPADLDSLMTAIALSHTNPDCLARSEVLDILSRLVETGTIEQVGE